jgi:hypothetical protein
MQRHRIASSRTTTGSYAHFARSTRNSVAIRRVPSSCIRTQRSRPSTASNGASTVRFFRALPIIQRELTEGLDAIESPLHTCFSWVGTGAFTAKSHVQRFLSTVSEIAYPRDEVGHTDNSFTLFQNEPPYVLSNELSQLPQPFGHSDGSGIARNKAFIVHLSACPLLAFRR